MMQTAALFGSDYPALGDVGVVTLAESTAAAISRGRFPKGYPHVDPNEDAVALAVSDDARLLAVADGHNGFEAAKAAIEAVLEVAGTLVVDADLGSALQSASSAIALAVQDLAPPRSESRSALSLALISDGILHTATAGDTVVVVIRDGHVRVFGGSEPFLGPDLDTEPPVSSLALEPGDLVVVASDGLPDFLGRGWPARLAGLASESAEVFVRAAVAAAFAGGAGDNVAVAATLLLPLAGEVAPGLWPTSLG